MSTEMEGFDLATYRQYQQSGEQVQPDPVDAAPADQEVELTNEYEFQDDNQPEVEDNDQSDENDDSSSFEANDEESIDDIPEQQKTAFQKRMERERRKIEEELKQQYEQQFSAHNQFFHQLGVDPEQAMKAIEDNRIRQQAQQLAYEQGWDEQQQQWYINQQKMDRELRELRIANQINEMADNPEYHGIKQMKPQIADMVYRNPSLSVEQAYWAIGGPKRAEQLRLEAQQREIAKRSQARRTVVKDTTSPVTDAPPLAPGAIAAARSIGLSESKARELLTADPIENLADYRRRMKKVK